MTRVSCAVLLNVRLPVLSFCHSPQAKASAAKMLRQGVQMPSAHSGLVRRAAFQAFGVLLGLCISVYDFSQVRRLRTPLLPYSMQTLFSTDSWMGRWRLSCAPPRTRERCNVQFA